MSSAKKTFGLLFYSFFTVIVSTLGVASFIIVLSFYGGAQESTLETSAQTLKFPENEQMLEELSIQLARDSAALSKIEPAAGNGSPAEDHILILE